MQFAETYVKNDEKSAFGILNFRASLGETFLQGVFDLFGITRQEYDTDKTKRKSVLTAFSRFGVKPDVHEDAPSGGKWLEAYTGKVPFRFCLPASKRRQSNRGIGAECETSGSKRVRRNGGKAQEKDGSGKGN
jgi:hypothetical protein